MCDMKNAKIVYICDFMIDKGIIAKTVSWLG